MTPPFSIPASRLSGSSFSMGLSAIRSIRRRCLQLHHTTPALHFGPPLAVEKASPIGATSSSGVKVKARIPTKVCALIRRLSEDTADPVLSKGTISRILRFSPTENFRKPGTAQTAALLRSKHLLPHVSKLFARGLYADAREEASWYPLIDKVLSGFPLPAASVHPFITHNACHSRLVDPELLPQRNGRPVPNVKPPSFSLSAFADPEAAMTSTCAIVEVKAPARNFLEATYQLAITATAILERLRRLDGVRVSKHGNEMPVLGWIVHGHFWYLQVTYREANGSIRILGPYPSGNTASYRGIYRLLGILDEVKKWGEELYFPNLSSKLSRWK